MNKIDVPKMNDHIRALGRGLEVIELLSQKGQMSLADLRHATGLPNPSLLRILSTLQHRKWVRRSIVEGRYELNHSLGALLGETPVHIHWQNMLGLFLQTSRHVKPDGRQTCALCLSRVVLRSLKVQDCAAQWHRPAPLWVSVHLWFCLLMGYPCIFLSTNCQPTS